MVATSARRQMSRCSFPPPRQDCVRLAILVERRVVLLSGLLAPQIFERFLFSVVGRHRIRKLMELLEAPRRKHGRTTHSAVLLSSFPEKKEIVAADTALSASRVACKMSKLMLVLNLPGFSSRYRPLCRTNSCGHGAGCESSPLDTRPLC